MISEERIEAAAKTLEQYRYADKSMLGSRSLANRMLKDAYPELANGTHVLVPRQLIEKMIAASQFELKPWVRDQIQSYLSNPEPVEAE